MDSMEDSHFVLGGCKPVLPVGDSASFHPLDREEWLTLYSATMEAAIVERDQCRAQRTGSVDELEAQPHPQQAHPAIDSMPCQLSTIGQCDCILG